MAEALLALLRPLSSAARLPLAPESGVPGARAEPGPPAELPAAMTVATPRWGGSWAPQGGIGDATPPPLDVAAWAPDKPAGGDAEQGCDRVPEA